MKWPRKTILLILGVFGFLVFMNFTSSDQAPEVWHVRNWPGWAHTLFGIFTVCVFIFALWHDFRDIREAFKAGKHEDPK